MDGSKLVYLFTDGQLGCLHLWTIVDSAAVNICVQMFENLLSILWEYTPNICFYTMSTDAR